MSFTSPKFTCTSPVNIAVIKYWGKENEAEHIPLNSSLSATLNQDDLKTTTTVQASTEFPCDELILNGKKEDVQGSKRIQRVFQEIRKAATAKWYTERPNKDQEIYVHIDSTNNFPTAAGLASSASGYCCLVFALGQLFEVKSDLSIIARLGSGSACRSLYGGYVAWEKGHDHETSKAIQVLDEHDDFSKQTNIVVCVVSDRQKHTPSTSGMQQSVITSKLLKVRASEIVPQRMIEMDKALKTKDFNLFATLTMDDSDNMHACCADTEPAIYYMNETSNQIVQLVKDFNAFDDGNGVENLKVAYTFDAGPNAVLFFPNKEVTNKFLAILHAFFPPSNQEQFFSKEPFVTEMKQYTEMVESFKKSTSVKIDADGLRYLIHTTVGYGPKVVSIE
ncbi:mevalonate decarboxylase [Naegleria gruberi]|uniref:Diphosphomevalonate decarboxylase n=1 Tax=Naegleria gruberi TaxID=5762 RepID=D2W352_NAEGR|nr:mevalonate decarboxylase [Naegleria gruberi]EFC36555.1 mevalonate decarboxylase [Naegleria gruberi]|eukprot:XP_002669299.1 mevalonate decarboxylase [Naegleria gruberi strain NEG-M]